MISIEQYIMKSMLTQIQSHSLHLGWVDCEH